MATACLPRVGWAEYAGLCFPPCMVFWVICLLRLESSPVWLMPALT